MNQNKDSIFQAEEEQLLGEALYQFAAFGLPLEDAEETFPLHCWVLDQVDGRLTPAQCANIVTMPFEESVVYKKLDKTQKDEKKKQDKKKDEKKENNEKDDKKGEKDLSEKDWGPLFEAFDISTLQTDDHPIRSIF